MVFLALLGLVTLGLLASEAFGSRRMQRSLWRDGFLVTVTHERLGIGRTPSEVEGREAPPWRAEVWLHGEDGQLPRSLALVKARLKLPPPARVHLLDGSLYTHAGPADFGELDRLVREMVAYAKDLSSAARRLRGQAFEAAMHGEGQGEQRLQALDLLLTHFPSSLEADLAAKDAIVDPHPAVRLRAARALGDGGLSVVKGVLRDRATPEPLRVEALIHLSRSIPRGPLMPLLIDCIESDGPSLRAEAQRLCGALQVNDAVPQLLAQLRDAGIDESRRLLATLGRIGDPRAEPTAAAHLDHRDAEVSREALRCLGRVGHPSTVVPRLKAWLVAGPRPAALRELAEALVDALRQPVHDRGLLSLVTDDSLGAVSVPNGDGAVALLSSGADEE